MLFEAHWQSWSGVMIWSSCGLCKLAFVASLFLLSHQAHHKHLYHVMWQKSACILKSAWWLHVDKILPNFIMVSFTIWKINDLCWNTTFNEISFFWKNMNSNCIMVEVSRDDNKIKVINYTGVWIPEIGNKRMSCPSIVPVKPLSSILKNQSIVLWKICTHWFQGWFALVNKIALMGCDKWMGSKCF